MRRLVVVTVFSVLVASNPALAATTPKAGGSCSKIGQKTRIGSLNLKCVQVGKKKIWQRQVAILVKPKPTPSGSRVIPVAEWDYPIDSDAITNALAAAAIERNVAANLQKQFDTLQIDKVLLDARIEPGTSPALAREWVSQAQFSEGVLRALGFASNTAVIVIGKSQSFVEAQLQSINCEAPGGIEYYMSRGAGAACGGRLTTWLTQGLDPVLDTKFMGEVTYYVAGSHEWTHIAQQSAASTSFGNIPLWMNEGMANLIGTLVAAKIYPDTRRPEGVNSYLFYRFRQTSRNDLLHRCSKPLRYYLLERNSQYKSELNDTCEYALGQLAWETLTAREGGLRLLATFYKKSATLRTNTEWKALFKEVFGLNEEELFSAVDNYLKG